MGRSIRVPAALLLCLYGLAPSLLADETADPKQAAAQAKSLAQRMGADNARTRFDALKEAAPSQHPLLLRAFVRLLKDDYAEIRKEAIRALGRRTDPKDRRRAAKALAGRLAPRSKSTGEEDRAELLAVVGALHDLAQRTTIEPLLDGVDYRMPREVARARLRAVANVPHADAVERLIGHMAKGRKRGMHRQLVAEALRYATGESLGNDPDRWRAWWKENRRRFDFEAAARRREEDRRREEERARRKEERKNRKRKRRPKPEEDDPA